MKLTKHDKKLLLNWGGVANKISRRLKPPYPIHPQQQHDWPYSGYFSSGTETYLSGIVRSAFHWSVVRETEDGRRVYFDSSNLFKN